MTRLAWIDRTWSFDSPVERYPLAVERLRGAPARLAELVAGLSRELLVRNIDGAWSIQENAGHLERLETLVAARLDDFLSGASVLSPWTGNEEDDRAAHDDKEIGDILNGFRAARERLVARLDELAPEDFARTASHPRLDQTLRLVDICLFQADHDDHHLARIQELGRAPR